MHIISDLDQLFKMKANVLQLGEVADLEALTFNLALMFIRITNVQFSTEPAILPNCCYLLCFLIRLCLWFIFSVYYFHCVTKYKSTNCPNRNSDKSLS